MPSTSAPVAVGREDPSFVPRSEQVVEAHEPELARMGRSARHQHPSWLEEWAEPVADLTHRAISTSASTAIGRPSEMISGFRSTERMSGRSIARRESPSTIAADRRPVHRRLAPEGPQQPLRHEVVEHLARVDGVDRREADRHVADRFGDDPADAHQHGGPELRDRAPSRRSARGRPTPWGRPAPPRRRRRGSRRPATPRSPQPARRRRRDPGAPGLVRSCGRCCRRRAWPPRGSPVLRRRHGPSVRLRRVGRAPLGRRSRPGAPWTPTPRAWSTVGSHVRARRRSLVGGLPNSGGRRVRRLGAQGSSAARRTSRTWSRRVWSASGSSGSRPSSPSRKGASLK